MNESIPQPDYSYVNQNAIPEPEPVSPPTWRDLAAPVLAVILSVLYWQTFSLHAVTTAYGPGLGVPVFTAAYFAAVFIVAAPRPSIEGLFLMCAALLLSVCCALYAHPGFMTLNCFIILFLSAAATFSLTGQSRFSPLSPRAFPEAVRLSVLALFTRIDKPFRSYGALVKGGKGRIGLVLGTTLVTALLLTAVLALLASADMVFGSFFSGLEAWLQRLTFWDAVWRTCRVLILALFLGSGLCFLRTPAPAVTEKARAQKQPLALPFLVPVLVLDLVYIIFCVIQIRYLFGGAEAASMAGGWAEYARSGFFQLVAVAGINLILCLSGAGEDRFRSRGGGILRAADGLLLLLTAVILASAFCRMRLYILAFGMSVLRLMTLWGMAAVLVGLLAAGWKLLRPVFIFWRPFFTFCLCSWCLLCLANPAGRVADYNVDAFLDGRLETADVYYLRDLTADAAPALVRLAEESDYYDDDVRYALGWLQDDVLEAEGVWSARKAVHRYFN